MCYFKYPKKVHSQLLNSPLTLVGEGLGERAFSMLTLSLTLSRERERGFIDEMTVPILLGSRIHFTSPGNTNP